MAPDDRTIASAPPDGGRGARRPGRPSFIVLRGENPGEVHNFDRPVTTLGRSADADIQLSGEGISRLHCRVAIDALGVTVEDLGSTNGTFVNGERLEAPRRLDEGDELSVGGHVALRFTRDEMIEQLRNAQHRLRQMTDERRAMLDGARDVQQGLVPQDAPVARPGLRLAGQYRPAAGCGGDFWTYRALTGDRTLILIGDVSGHGLDSAMITATAKAAIDVGFFLGKDQLDASRALEIMNQAIRESTHGALLMTCFACVIDPRRATATFANASHEFPYLLGADGSVRSLTGTGAPLGLEAGSRYAPSEVALRAGDSLVFYTDGLVDRVGPDGKPFGDRRLRRALEKAAASSPEVMRDHVIAEADRHAGGVPQGDDIAVVVARFTGHA